MSAWLYIVKCSDGSYYAGTTRTTLERRLAEHNEGSFGGDKTAGGACLLTALRAN